MFRFVLPLLASLLFAFTILPTITNAQCVITVSAEGNCPTAGECYPTIRQALTAGLLRVENNNCTGGALTIALADPTFVGTDNCVLILTANNTKNLSSFSLISTASPSEDSSTSGSGSSSGGGTSDTTTTFNCTGDSFHIAIDEPNYPINIEGINFVEGDAKILGSVSISKAAEPITFTNCRFYSNNGMYGAGACLMVVNNSVTLNNVVFDENSAVNNGGGMFLSVYETVPSSATFIFNNTRFKSNTAVSGGGLFLESPQTVTTYLTNLTVTGNHAQEDGGGVYFAGAFNINGISMRTNKAKNGGGMALFNTWGHVEQGTIHNNTVTQSGGGIYFSSTNVELKEIQVFGNTAAQEGGGVYMWQSADWRSSPKNVDNSIFKSVEINNNQAGGYGGGVFLNDSISDWQGVLFTGNQGKPQGGFTIQDSDVYCTPFSQSNYCTRCSCRDQCGSCASQGCSLQSEDSCICYVEMNLEDACNNYDLPSGSGSGDQHHSGLVLGLVFGLALPLVVFAVLGAFLFTRWRKRTSYQTLDAQYEETSNLIHPL